MTIDFHILVGGAENHRQRIQTIIDNVFVEVDQIYNRWNPHSELSQFNKQQTLESIPLSNKLYRLLKAADKIVIQTNGRFDPTVEPVQELWKQALSQGQIPDMQLIEELKPAMGWDKIQFDSHSIKKLHPKTALDLGGIAKGYAVDLLFESLNASGFSILYVEWGGEIRVSKEHPSGRPWQIGIAGMPKGKITAILELTDQAVATSGDYEQAWPIGTKTYYHIINPFTLQPLEQNPKGIFSSTVVAKTCTIADGLAKTGLFFENKQDAEKWADSLQDDHLFIFIQERNDSK